MAYCSQTDLERAVGAALVLRLFDDDASGAVDTSTLTDVLADADAEINGYIGRLYSVATVAADPPSTLRRLAVDVAIQLGYLRRPEYLNEKGETPWEGRYRRALQKLADIRDAKWRLDVDADPAEAKNVSQGGVYDGPSDDYPDGVGSGIFEAGWFDF